MYNIMRNSVSGMIANQEKINIVSNNIVNVQTTGYKKLDAGFSDLYTKSLDIDSNPNNSNDSITGTGVKISNATRVFTQGSLDNTNIDTNLAIEGDGFFRMIKADGSYAYTRNGAFSVDRNGKLVDGSGNLLDIDYANGIRSENIDLSSGTLNIEQNGEVFLNNTKIGQIDLYIPQGTNDLISVGDSLFILKNGANMDIIQDSNIEQGYIEMSNVDLQSEITNLITVQRAFQFNSKGIQALDEMWGMINNLQSR